SSRRSKRWLERRARRSSLLRVRARRRCALRESRSALGSRARGHGTHDLFDERDREGRRIQARGKAAREGVAPSARRASDGRPRRAGEGALTEEKDSPRGTRRRAHRGGRGEEEEEFTAEDAED